MIWPNSCGRKSNRPCLSSATIEDRRDFQPWQPTRRKRGTGCVYQINDHLWEGKYTPRNADGKRISRSVYGRNKEECEEKLAVLIQTVKAEIGAEKALQKQETPSEMMMQ